MKHKERPSAIAALICCTLGLLSFLLLLYPSYDGIDLLIYLYMIFFGLAIVFGSLSLFIKKNNMALTALIIGSVFEGFFLILLLLLKDMCVVC